MERSPRVRYLDVLRGVAVLLVIFVHVGQRAPAGTWFVHWSQYGQYGVQLFFVISAYSLCLAMQSTAESHAFGPFMLRRYLRIAPMYYFALGAFFAGTWFLEQHAPAKVFFTPTEQYSWHRVVANVLLVHGLVEDANNNIVPGGWSIGCEFLFYVLFPAFLRTVLWRRWLVVAIPVAVWIALRAAVASMPVLTEHAGFIYYSAACQFPCFAMGVLLYLYRDHWLARWSWVTFFPAAYALVRTHHSSGGWLLAPVFASVAAAGLWDVLRRTDCSAGLAWLGRLSFSIYCLHYAVIRLLAEPLMDAACRSGWSPAWVGVTGFVAATIMSATVSRVTFQFVERPGMQWGKWLTRLKSPANAPTEMVAGAGGRSGRATQNPASPPP